MPSVSEILANAPIACVLASNDIDRGQIYGRRLNTLLPKKIFAFSTVIQRIYDNSGIVIGVDAVGTITMLDIGNVGDSLEIFVDDPDLGSISLGSYTQQDTDTTASILATSIASALNGSNGYAFSSSGADVLITARTGLGSNINGGGRLTVIITATSYVLSEGDNYLITEDDNRIIIE